MEVLRFDSSEILEGQINGRTLVVASTFGGQPSGGQPSGGTSGGGTVGDGYLTYNTVTDTTYSIHVNLPADWDEIDGTQLTDDYGDVIGPSITASANLDEYAGTWEEPGVFIFATTIEGQFTIYDYLELVAGNLEGSCEFVRSENYTDEAYQGVLYYYTACGGIADYLVLGVVPIDAPESYMIGVEVQVLTDADWVAAETIFTSVDVIGQLAPADIGDPYMTITDDYGSIKVTVPSNWVDIDGSAWIYDDEVIGGSVSAASDLYAFYDWKVPGVIFSASDDLADLGGYIQVLDSYRDLYREECDFVVRDSYEDNLYRGKYDFFEKCGGSGGPDFIVLSVVSKENQYAFIIVVQITITSDDDWDGLTQILDSFEVVGTLP
jgi:serine protease Do